ncbi:MAG: UDP-3-O-[3-hydroxymyristoyl] N-acetylglucosamine deacetylase [Verrucomicrobiae bacterium]|nr:UDP-3-O-[3-hydroxymyristoyl] N-acetylglucosamine deacetylase [Verrucomicrobiae bacterium]
MPQQQTIRKAASFSGIGLHSGNRVTLTFLPASPNTGLRFRRVDLEDRPELDARTELVVDTQRSTTLGRGAVRIHTVEHVLAALAGAGVTNAVIDLDANEPPIGDGSSREFARMLRDVGLEVQPDPIEPLRLTAPVEVQVGAAQMAAFPHPGLKLTCTSVDKGGRFTQFYSLEVTPESWERELSHARTFGFLDEIEHLYRNGLIRGASLENAIIVRDDAVLTNEPLRYPEEFVRHKMLDLVGDLALIGRPLHAHILAVRPSHQANTELARAILAQARKPLEAAQSFAPPPPEARPRASRTESRGPASAAVTTPDSTETVVRDGAVLDIDQVMKMLPHRPPFLMVDRVTRIAGNQITGLKQVTMGEPYFSGHFPGHPIMPGVLQLEAIAQVAGILLMRQADNLGKLAYFMSAEDVKWRKPVRPGDSLVINVELTKTRGRICKAKGVCTVNGETVSEAEVTFMLVDR